MNVPAAIGDTSLPASTRRAALDRWWTRRRRAACQPRRMAMRVLGPDGGWYLSSPGRPSLAGTLLAYATDPRPRSPEAIDPAEAQARERWAREVLEPTPIDQAVSE